MPVVVQVPLRWSGVRRHMALLLAVAMALLTAVLVYNYLSRFAETMPVVVAARDLEGPRLIEAGDVKVVPVPVGSVHPLAFNDPGAVVGQWLKGSAVAGEMLLAPHLAGGPTGGSPLQIVLQQNQVGFFLPAPLERMLGGAVSPGDKVDLIFVGSRGRGEQARSDLLAAAVPVLEVRDQDGLPLADEGRGRSLPAGLVLAVTPFDAQRLAFALEHGQVYVALRSAFTPLATAVGAGVTWDNLLQPAVPAPPEAGPPAGGEDSPILSEPEE
ncbi:MAG TPA: Flp pilus assembly protein CpaB [Sphingobacteriaceae bacterium]|nr:Flp pilus assembly protein CpaB [Sphingobacteriaceae bacterium]